MIVALSRGQELGLLVVAGVFIGFALLSSFVFPRMNPNFPGRRRLPLFVAVTVLLLVSMLTAMTVLAREDEEPAGHVETEGAESEPPPGESEPAEPPPAPAQEGNAAAGKQVFASAGCVACHTLADAGSSGAVGPNLDDAKPSYKLVVDRVTNGQGGMPSFKGQLSEADIQNVAAYVSSVAGS